MLLESRPGKLISGYFKLLDELECEDYSPPESSSSIVLEVIKPLFRPKPPLLEDRPSPLLPKDSPKPRLSFPSSS